jgi:hypothetical protein
VLADVDAISSAGGALDTLVPATVGLLVVGWAVVIWIRARRHSRNQRDALH